MTVRTWILSSVALCTLAPLARPQLSTPLLPNGVDPKDQLGSAIAVDGTRLVIGAKEQGGGGFEGPGAVFVYEETGGLWIKTQKLDPNSPFGIEFGASVAVSSSLIASGATEGSGAAIVFERQGSTWVFLSKLFDPDALPDTHFGMAVAIAGSQVMVGARKNAVNANGLVRVYEKGGASMILVDTIDPASTAGFGSALAAETTRAVVGAPGADIPTTAGTAHVVERQGSTWTSTAILAASDGTLGNRFGTAVAVSGTRVLVGATADAAGPQQSGAAYVFELQGSQWIETAKLKAPVPTPNARFGAAVAIDGERVLIGTPGEGAGAAHLFELQNGVWVHALRVEEPGGTTGDSYGSAVALCAEHAFIGAPFDDAKGPNSGSAYFVEFDCNGNAQLDAVEIATGAVADCDGNKLPDACDVELGADGNGNQIPDACEIDTAYCAAKVNSDGCMAPVLFNGTASLTAPSSFDIEAQRVVPGQNGLFFYGLAGPTATPFSGGTLCVVPPLRRTTLQNSGGAAGTRCDGAFSFDFNAWLQSGNDPMIGAATRVNGQYWHRDTADPLGIGLTQAIEFYVQP